MVQRYSIPPEYGQNALSPRAGNPFVENFTNALTAPRVTQRNAMQQQPTNPLAFGDRLAQSESGGNYGARNEFGYSGKYQFGQDRLDDFNRVAGYSLTTDDLMASPELQEQVFQWHISDIDRAIDENGLTSLGYSRDALRSVAHLGGVNGMIRFARTGGGYNPSDAYGTSLSDYARRHG